MLVYFCSQVLFIVFLLFYKWFFNNESVLTVLTFFPIFFTVIYVVMSRYKIERKEKILTFALLIAAIGDVFFMYFNNKIWGIYSFFLIQLFHFYYFDGRKSKIPYFFVIALIVFLICLILKKGNLIFMSVIYFGIFSYNLYTSLRYKMTSRKSIIIIIGFLCLAVCDFSIFLNVLGQKFNILYLLDKFIFTIEWIFYVAFQLLISYAITMLKS